ncbi:hypothetical protein [Thalassiella azotivora]
MFEVIFDLGPLHLRVVLGDGSPDAPDRDDKAPGFIERSVAQTDVEDGRPVGFTRT